MLGLAYIGIIIVFSFMTATAYAYAMKIYRNKKVGTDAAPTETSRIYYVKNSEPKKRKRVQKRPDIAIKGAVIEKSADKPYF